MFRLCLHPDETGSVLCLPCAEYILQHGNEVNICHTRLIQWSLQAEHLSVDVGRVAKQANGAALMHYGDTTVLCTATASDKPREGIDFFPLSVEFEEKMYSVGKIPGGFNKREGKASENAVLDSTCYRPSDASVVPEGLPQ